MNEISKTLEVFNQKLIEVRIIDNKKTYSGYFSDYDKLQKAIIPFSDCNIYFVINRIKEECYSREQKDRIIQNPKNTTSDNDIAGRDWILIDIDSKRASGVSATEEEKKHSKEVGNKVYTYLKNIGFSEPISADSGNGVHLLYNTTLQNTAENTDLIRNFLSALSMLFSTDKAEIDTSVFNASRITKLYGTVARKGTHTDDRPHRQSKLLKVPETITGNRKELLERVANELPQPEKRTYRNDYTQFNLQDFISDNGIKVKQEVRTNNVTKYVLEHCIFDHSHKGKDACIFELPNGALGYKCFHNSCSHRKWQDVRLHFDRDAYNKKFEYQNYRHDGKKEVFKPKVEVKGDKFLTLDKIEYQDRSKIVSIKSGFDELDRKIVGFNKGEVSLWSGNNGSGKTTILNQLILNSADKGYKTVIFSGELTSVRMKNWLHLQSAGRQNTRPSEYENLYYVPKSTGVKIDKWLSDKVYIYNNDYGNEFTELFTDIEQFLERVDIDVLVIDNIMAINLINLSNELNGQQTQAILKIVSLAKQKDIHIHIVAHPRKSVGFLRKTDISGTANLSNAVDNVLICHRVNQDFRKTAPDFYEPKVISAMVDIDGYSNVIEVCKNRDLGVMDLLVGLHYEVESKRVLNNQTDNPIYGWDYEETPSLNYNDFTLTKTTDQFGNESCPF